MTFSVQRLSNFVISVGDSFDPVSKDSFDTSTSTQCAHIPGKLGNGETRVIQCNQPVRGRYVTVNLNEKNALTICEFQVHGTLVSGKHLLHFSQSVYCMSVITLILFETIVCKHCHDVLQLPGISH